MKTNIKPYNNIRDPVKTIVLPTFHAPPPPAIRKTAIRNRDTQKAVEKLLKACKRYWKILENIRNPNILGPYSFSYYRRGGCMLIRLLEAFAFSCLSWSVPGTNKTI